MLNYNAVNSEQPSKDLYNKVKASFIMKNTTLGAWCREVGLKQQNVMTCLIGSWNGPKAKELRMKVINASGLNGNVNKDI